MKHPGGSCRYTVYGFCAGPTQARLAYCGEYRDPLTGHYSLGQGRRFYSPILMRFISPDSLSPFDRGDTHAYAYCLADPVNHIDRTGASAVRIFAFSINLLEGTLNIVDGAMATLNTFAQARHQERAPRLIDSSRNVLKVYRGVFKVASALVALNEQGGLPASVTTVASTLDSAAKLSGITERLLNISVNTQAVGRFLWQHPEQAGDVIGETLGIITGLSALRAGLRISAQAIRRPHVISV